MPTNREKRELELLDAIEDANAELESRKLRIRAWSYFGCAITFLVGVSIILGANFGEYWFIGTIFFTIGLVVYAVFTGISIADNDLTTTKQRMTLLKAERAYRNFLAS